MTTATVTYHELPTWETEQYPGPDTQLSNSNSNLHSSLFSLGNYEDKWQAHSSLSTALVLPSATPFIRTSAKRATKNRNRPFTISCEELCLVCGDKASGYHYNALTCEGCKGFFRRSITRKATYYCKFGQTCEIDMYMRRKCQHCRLQKCSKIGMRAELVIPEEQCRIKREAKLRQKTVNHYLPSSSKSDGHHEIQDTSSQNSSVLPLETQELISRLTSLSKEFSMPSDEAMTSLTMYSSSSQSPFQHLAELIILEAQLAHEFIKNLPGFSRLDEEDKKSIQKMSKSDLFLLRAVQRYNSQSDHIIFGNDNYQYKMTEFDYNRAGLLQSKHIFNFIRSLAKLKPDTIELALLQAIVIFSERDSFLNKTEVDEIQEVYTLALQQYIEAKRPVGQKTLYAKYIVKIADLKRINANSATLSSFS